MSSLAWPGSRLGVKAAEPRRDVSSVRNPPANPPLPLYKFTNTETGKTMDADDLLVAGHGGNDTIEIKTCFTGRVSGNAGDDSVTLIDCGGVGVIPLTGGDYDPGPPPVDGADTITFENSVNCQANGGDLNDIFRWSGDCSRSSFYGGGGNDDFAGGGTFANGVVDCGDDDDILTGSGNWAGATVDGGAGVDRIDCRATSGNLKLTGGAGNDKLYGGSGNDELTGDHFGTWVDSTEGADSMVGGGGDDKFFAVDLRRDILEGGAGNDTAEVDAGANGELLIRSIETVIPKWTT